MIKVFHMDRRKTGERNEKRSFAITRLRDKVFAEDAVGQDFSSLVRARDRRFVSPCKFLVATNIIILIARQAPFRADDDVPVLFVNFNSAFLSRPRAVR